MINRIELKTKAKEVLSRENTYWISFIVCILVGMISNIVSATTARFNISLNTTPSELSQTFIPTLQALTPLMMITLTTSLLLSCLFGIFLYQPLAVGQRRFFIKSAEGNNEITTIFEIFKGEHYINVVKILFFKNLYLLLYGFIFIILYAALVTLSVFLNLSASIALLSLIGLIPFIMKAYSYYMVEYIIAENPSVSRKEVFKMSSAMMSEYRFSTFVLELSFNGWIILGLMLCGVGVIFVTPYIEATMTQLYFQLKGRLNKYDYCYE